MSAVGLDQLCLLDPSSQTNEDKRMVEALIYYDYCVGNALQSVIVKSRVSSIMIPKEGPVLASEIWAKLLGFFECEAEKIQGVNCCSKGTNMLFQKCWQIGVWLYLVCLQLQLSCCNWAS